MRALSVQVMMRQEVPRPPAELGGGYVQRPDREGQEQTCQICCGAGKLTRGGTCQILGWP
ncbi:MAG: hypothetical protein KatS3mg109_2070 [Pirellulaceae bacterium]|nr:MAG: hypothetical protein KatS3mg109_2070 [Pirellulaceae bacterium]